MNDPDWLALLDDRLPISVEDRAQKIADVLATGTPSPQFCRTLAKMIRPHERKCVSPYKFKLHRARKGQPKGPDWWAVAWEMERLVDREGVSEDAAIFQIQRDFGMKGNSKRKCQDALYTARTRLRLAREFEEAYASESAK